MAPELRKRLHTVSLVKRQMLAEAPKRDRVLPAGAAKLQNGIWQYLTKRNVHFYFGPAIPRLGFSLKDAPPMPCKQMCQRWLRRGTVPSSAQKLSARACEHESLATVTRAHRPPHERVAPAREWIPSGFWELL